MTDLDMCQISDGCVWNNAELAHSWSCDPMTCFSSVLLLAFVYNRIRKTLDASASALLTKTYQGKSTTKMYPSKTGMYVAWTSRLDSTHVVCCRDVENMVGYALLVLLFSEVNAYMSNVILEKLLEWIYYNELHLALLRAMYRTDQKCILTTFN